ncbi:MAG: STAS domain-containing protein [Candidatus Wallbacteria bacterium]|nr:STAS domain-containing protein [Candidatus Wallbacteria bacterium]
MEITIKRKNAGVRKQYSDEGSLNREIVVTIVSVKGNFTAANCRELEDKITDLILNGLGNIVLNLSEVGMIDSMGVSTLLNILKMVKQYQTKAEIKITELSKGVNTRLLFTTLTDEEIKLIAPQNGRAQKVLKMVHLQDLITIYDDEEKAVHSFGG